MPYVYGQILDIWTFGQFYFLDILKKQYFLYLYRASYAESKYHKHGLFQAEKKYLRFEKS